MSSAELKSKENEEMDTEDKQIHIADLLISQGGARFIHCCQINPILAAIAAHKYYLAKYLF